MWSECKSQKSRSESIQCYEARTSSIVGCRLCELRDGGDKGEGTSPWLDSEPTPDSGGKEERHRLGTCTPYDAEVSVECALEGSAYVVVGVTWDSASGAFIAGSTGGPPCVGVGFIGRDTTVAFPFSSSFSASFSTDPCDAVPRLRKAENGRRTHKCCSPRFHNVLRNMTTTAIEKSTKTTIPITTRGIGGKATGTMNAINNPAVTKRVVAR